jgi:TM2 domain-containing membrane protein YozV
MLNMSALLGWTFLALAIPMPTASLAITYIGVWVATQAAQLETGFTFKDSQMKPNETSV